VKDKQRKKTGQMPRENQVIIASHLRQDNQGKKTGQKMERKPDH
jgi:hypothetical protein